MNYRVYLLDPDHCVEAAEHFTADDDATAMQIAAGLYGSCRDVFSGYEVWQGTRRIAPDTFRLKPEVTLDDVIVANQDHIVDLVERMRLASPAIRKSQRLLEVSTHLLRRPLLTKATVQRRPSRSPAKHRPFPQYPLTTAIQAGLHRATAVDAAAVRDLARLAFARWVPVIGREPKQMRADHAAAVRDHMVDLLQLGGDLVGLVEMRAGADHLFIEHVTVSPAYQTCGYGYSLLKHAEAVTRRHGFKHLRLAANARFTDSVRLYKCFGFQVDREEIDQPHGIFLHMSKSLDQDDR